MVQKRGLPSVGEVVICKITRLNPNSAFAVLDEYGHEGMIHISEVSSGWVRDIRNHIKEGQSVIAKVVRIDDRGISLSLKRVDEKQKKDKMREYNLNQKAEKMLDMAAHKLGKNLEQAYNEVGFLLQESFGSLYEGFRRALSDAEELRKKGVPEGWIAAVKEIAEKNIEQKEFEFVSKIFLRSYKENGINLIKDVLEKAELMGLEVKYISAPEYMVKYRTKSAKKGEKEFLDKLDKIVSLSKPNVEAEFKIVKK